MLGGGVALLFLLLAVDKGMKTDHAEQSRTMRAACDPQQADRMVQQMMTEHFFHKMRVKTMDDGTDFLFIDVNEMWYLIPVEDKTRMDGVIQCHFTQGRGETVNGAYSDVRSGKTVAYTGGASGFRMK